MPPVGNDFIGIAAGNAHSLALKRDGSIVGWGILADPPEGNDFIAIAAGDHHGLAIKKVIQPVVEARVQILPKLIVRHSSMKRFLVWVRLPEEISKEQVDSDSPLVLYPGELEPVRQFVLGGRGGVTIMAFFSVSELLDSIEENGLAELEVGGLLKDGREFYGTGDVLIKATRRRPGRWWRRGR